MHAMQVVRVMAPLGRKIHREITWVREVIMSYICTILCIIASCISILSQEIMYVWYYCTSVLRIGVGFVGRMKGPMIVSSAYNTSPFVVYYIVCFFLSPIIPPHVLFCNLTSCYFFSRAVIQNAILMQQFNVFFSFSWYHFK